MTPVATEVTRDTSVGQLPASWSVLPFGDLFEIQQGKALNQKAREGPSQKPFLRTSNVYWGELSLDTIDEMSFTPEQEEKYELVPGDLLVCEGGEIGRAAIWGGELEACHYQNHLHRCRVFDQRADSEFYMYWMRYAFLQRRLYEGHGNVTTIANLSKSRLAAFEVAVPPVAEQRAIARVLRTVQEAREATEQVIAAGRELKRSLMRHLFSYGMASVATASARPLKATDVGELPSDWEVSSIDGVAIVLDRLRVPLSGKERSARKGPYPYCGANGVLDHIDDFIFDGEHVLLAEDGGRWGPFEESAYRMSGRFWVNNHAHILKALDDVTRNDYLTHWLNYDNIDVHISGSTRGKLNQGVMRDLQLPLPPLPEQRAIAEALNIADQKIVSTEQRSEALDTLFSSLLSELMSGRLRVPESMWESAA